MPSHLKLYFLNASKKSQIQPNTSKYGQIQPSTSKYSQIQAYTTNTNTDTRRILVRILRLYFGPDLGAEFCQDFETLLWSRFQN